MNSEQQWQRVRAHIAQGDKAKDKAEQHYISAGRHLKDLKAEHTGTWAEWIVLVKEKAGIGKSRASELMQIADGRKTVEQVRDRSSESSGASHAKARALSRSPLIIGEDADALEARRQPAEKRQEGGNDSNHAEPSASTEAMKAKHAALDEPDDLPTGEEVEASYQDTLYNQACLLLERMTGETRQRFFAYVQRKYPDAKALDAAIPHAMGAAVAAPPVVVGNFRITESKVLGDPGPMPEFLRRAAP